MAGLFDEDEWELVNFIYDSRQQIPVSRLLELQNLTSEQEQIISRIPDSLTDLLKRTMSNPFLSTSSLKNTSVTHSSSKEMLTSEQRRRMGYQLHYGYLNRICSGIIGLCRGLVDASDQVDLKELLHGWILEGKTIRVNAEVLQTQRQIQPLLQEAIQLRRQTRLWDKVFTVEGPLTWKDFLK